MTVKGQDAFRDATSRAGAYAIIVLLLTSVHHAYGAFVYDTPWRLHILPLGGVTALVIGGSLALMRRQGQQLAGRLARGAFVATILAVPVATIGVVEGFYNHLLKNVLHFAGGSSALMTRLFPPPTYQLPNDVFFEATGILQVVPALLALWHLYRMRGRHSAQKPVQSVRSGHAAANVS